MAREGRVNFILTDSEFEHLGVAIKAALTAERQKQGSRRIRDFERLNARWLQLKIEIKKEQEHRAED